jgi:hypothetical protein
VQVSGVRGVFVQVSGVACVRYHRGMGRTLAALGVVLMVGGCGAQTAGTAEPEGRLSVSSSVSSVVTTTPPGGRMNARFCRFETFEGGPYYVQVFNPQVPGDGMCAGAVVSYTQEEFGAIPGLKRRCILDRDEQIAQKRAIVSIYSDGAAESVAAARLMCSNSGNEFIE